MTRRKEPRPRPILICHPPFDGEPFVQTRVTSGAYDIRLLPADFTLEEQVNFVRAQLEANRLPICLVHPDTKRVGAYFREDGRVVVSPRPEGGVIFAERLAPCLELRETPELAARRVRLAALSHLTFSLAGGPGVGITVLLGDQRKGGRKPSDEEKRRLSARGTDGVPRGLSRCEACHEWRGECFDPKPVVKGLIVLVSCSCAGQNHCARCKAPLHERRLETNYFDEETGRVERVPGLAALEHRCGG